ncbi:MAG: cysteine methyltransferase [Deltaproteobacteria bacterium CG_4_10_14_0_2_um_filter_43_8]|nr:MAG: cysteine methyltransferase [Deltaproteobacteria bacterium CG11_big_fil_rev_8_21_14_0_20_42_23]PJA21402.1 MAG: cysteine methyltransferase [Deltaproteobacteria bacterium CG_4_10_14_0_2_um_filter_43_8]PJC63867.1 MAG: cysteine methyltransferase [Deltaproteobacteria bacterium CG_4_9_14_0_2_um_filter_42_21]
MNDYQRIEKAIAYIQQNFLAQPELDDIAKQVHLSPFHFQRLFKEWAGVTPKKFLQYLSIEYAKKLLKKNLSLLDASLETGLSGTSRLHDLFVTVEGMTPGEYKNGGENLTLHYRYASTLFGNIIIASTSKGICHLAFIDDEVSALEGLQQMFPKAVLLNKKDALQEKALKIFSPESGDLEQIKLHLKATPFQLKVWQSLLKIPPGRVESYSAVAAHIRSKAVRAVGSAIAKNPVAYLIPCHRVIQSTGCFGQYRWGSAKKASLIGWEVAQIHKDDVRPLA